MYLSEAIQQKWQPVLDHPELPKVTDGYKRAVTAMVLENQRMWCATNVRTNWVNICYA